MNPAVALTIAGSDSGGGAGIQADLATFAALGVHGASAITAITVQNTTGVHQIFPLRPALVRDQALAVLVDLPVGAVKLGMLGGPEIVRAVAGLAQLGRLPRLVIDPVLVATSGDRLSSSATARAIVRELLPHAQLITPNGDEAAELLGMSVASTLTQVHSQARSLHRLGPAAVVITGFQDGPDRVDVLITADGLVELRAESIRTENDHGTGCTFAAAATATLAAGTGPANPTELHGAVLAAQNFTREALRRSASWDFGGGAGPVSHLLCAPSIHPVVPQPEGDPHV